MIVYHGTPFGGDRAGVTRFLRGRHALIPFPRQEDCEAAFDVCQTVVFDNGAFTAWKKGDPVADWAKYYEWCKLWYKHPAFAWAVIPDVINGSEQDNDDLISEWKNSTGICDGVPVWHLHESLDRLDRFCDGFARISVGSSGQYATSGTPQWWKRMIQAMNIICGSDGRPRTRIHGLRMAAQEYTSRFPFASVDSSNVAQNASLIPRFGIYAAPQRWQRAEAIAHRMEAFETTGEWSRAQWIPTEGRQLFQTEEEA